MPALPPGRALPDLTPEEERRYARQLVLPEVGPSGQRKLKAARVLLVGAGGLGSPAALYLAAAGVGTLCIVEGDRVDLSNLHRQVLHGTADLGRSKAESARGRLREQNPEVRVEIHPEYLTAANAQGLVGAHDLVVDGTDNFAARYLLNDACVLAGRPLVHGSVHRFEGQATVLCAPGGPCYRCLYPEPPPPGTVPSCAEGGVLGVVPGLIGLVQATEAIKWIIGAGQGLVGRLLLLDALGLELRTVRIARDPACPACGTREIQAVGDLPAGCGPGAAAGGEVPTLTPSELRARLRAGEAIDLVDVREPEEWARGHLAGARLSPLSRLAEALPSFDRRRDAVVYCTMGGRSAQAARELRAAGITRVWSLAGGLRRWEVESPPGPEAG